MIRMGGMIRMRVYDWNGGYVIRMVTNNDSSHSQYNYLVVALEG